MRTVIFPAQLLRFRWLLLELGTVQEQRFVIYLDLALLRYLFLVFIQVGFLLTLGWDDDDAVRLSP